MLGMMYYSLFLIMGVLYSDVIFKDKTVWFKIWAGGIFGNIALMFGIVPIAVIFGFNVSAHIVLAIIFTGIYLFLKAKPNLHITKPSAPTAIVVGGITLLICALMSNHILASTDGGVASGQSTYGDLAMHLGFVTSIAERGIFPPEYNLLSGTRLSYPFLIDSLSSSLYLFDTSLRTAVLYPSFVFSGLIVMGFYFLAEKLTNSKNAAILATCLFFLGGGFGFAYFLDGTKADVSNFTRIFTEYYKTPTNLNENNIRWANPICDMIVPQRTTMAGWCVLFFALWVLADCIQNKKRSGFVLLGVIAGSMPMIHTHSFLALGVISAGVFFAFIFNEPNKKGYIVNWCIYGAVAFALAIGQLIYWTFSQSVGNSQFLRFSFNWVNHIDPYFWFWLKNWGITAIFAVPALINAKGFKRKFMWGAIVLFVLSELILFQPNEYDNNKLFFVVYAILVMLTADYFLILYEKIKGIGGTKVLAGTVLFFGLFSGILTIGREYKSGADFKTFTYADLEFSEFVKNNIPKDAVFATGNHHLNPVCVLSGRSVYAGSELYVYFHGYADELAKRYGELKSIYESKTPKELENNLKKVPQIEYILISRNEEDMYDIEKSAFSEQTEVYSKNGIYLYEVKY